MLRSVAAGLALLMLSSCGGGDAGVVVGVVGDQPGPSPFISFLRLSVPYFPDLTSIEFTIAAKPGSASKPVDVTYTMGSLAARGYYAPSSSVVTLPVFGLYAGYANQVTVLLHYEDGTSKAVTATLNTAAYVDPNGIYDQPTILKKRSPNTPLGFDFFVMKSAIGSAVVVDTDGEIRWVAPGIANSTSLAVDEDEFVIGDAAAPIVHRMRLDGTTAESPSNNGTYVMFHHNMDHGATDYLAELDTQVDGVNNIESTISEITDQGTILNQWDLAAIISNYMNSQGDDGAAFVRPGVDWFHSNSSIYDPGDDSLIVSSRENFVIKLGYHTGNIIWILGDPTKYWYTFRSLRAKALTLNAGGLYPIGQHALSITSDGLLMLFNDGYYSVNQPAGAPAGAIRFYSAVSAYAIDAATMTAQNSWNFDYNQSIYSSICSSAYEAASQSILVDYATADYETHTRMVGLNSAHEVIFDFQYADKLCNTSWNALPMPFDGMTIDH